LYLRGGVHDERSQNIGNLIQFIRDLCLFDKGEDFLHEGHIQQSYLFALLDQFYHHFGFLARSRPHLFRQVGDALQIVAVGPVDECREDVRQILRDSAAALQ